MLCPSTLPPFASNFPPYDVQQSIFDNPGGTQVAQPSLDRMNDYLVRHNANHGGAFQTSRESDAIVDQARAAVADFFNASQPEEIVFGNNMTSLTFADQPGNCPHLATRRPDRCHPPGSRCQYHSLGDGSRRPRLQGTLG